MVHPPRNPHAPPLAAPTRSMEKPLPPTRHNLRLPDRHFLPLRAEIPRRAEHRHRARRALVPAHGVRNGDSVAR